MARQSKTPKKTSLGVEITQAGLEAPDEEKKPRERTVQDLREELERMQRVRQEETAGVIQMLNSMRTMQSALEYYAKQPNGALAIATLMGLGYKALPGKSADPDRAQDRGHKGVEGVLADSEEEEPGLWAQKA
jgi:hypothetical protein